MITWNREKCIRWRIKCGFENQKYLSDACTSGIPWTTACLSVISRAIFVKMDWSFVPTAKIIWENYVIIRFVPILSLYNNVCNWEKALTTKGSNDAQNIAFHPAVFTVSHSQGLVNLQNLDISKE